MGGGKPNVVIEIGLKMRGFAHSTRALKAPLDLASPVE